MNAKSIAAAGFLTLAIAAHAQNQPKGLEPLPEPPPPPRMAIDPALEPQITILQRGSDKVEEFRIRGRLYMIRITPPGGAPYVLMDQKGDGQFSSPNHGPADAYNLSVPQWVIGRF